MVVFFVSYGGGAKMFKFTEEAVDGVALAIDLKAKMMNAVAVVRIFARTLQSATNWRKASLQLARFASKEALGVTGTADRGTGPRHEPVPRRS